MVEEIKEEYTETDINMWGMEIKRINSMLEGISNLFLFIRNPKAIADNPNISTSLSDILMELQKTIDVYIEDENKRNSMWADAEKLQDESFVIITTYTAGENESEEYNNPEQLYNFYKHANKIHRNILEELNILGLRIPYKTRKDVDAMLKKKAKEREKEMNSNEE